MDFPHVRELVAKRLVGLPSLRGVNHKSPYADKENMIFALIVALAIIGLFVWGAAGTLHFLIWVAIICAVLWIIGFFVRGGGGPGGRRGWYYW